MGQSGLAEGGYMVGWTRAGEYLEYTLNVPAAGTYRLDMRVASKGVGGQFHVRFNDVDKTGTMSVPDTGSWADYTTVSKSVSLSAGVQVMRVRMDANSTTNGNIVGRCNWLRLSRTPLGPTDLTATTVSSSQIALNWLDNSSDETGYLIQQNMGNGTYQTVATVGANATGYTVGGLAASTAYSYVVVATGPSGNSGPTNQASATTSATGGGPGVGAGAGRTEDCFLYKVTLGYDTSSAALSHLGGLVAKPDWFVADNPQAAVLKAVSGSIEVQAAGTQFHGGQNVTFTFAGLAFDIGELEKTEGKDELKGQITFEDLTGDRYNDIDFDDRVWPVTVEYAYITSTVWEPIDAALEANTGNGTAGTAVGLQIHPDATSPTGPARRAVRVKSTLSRPIYGATINFAAIDIDDVSSSAAPVDDERNVSDNRGSGFFDDTSATTDALGVASVVYNVPMQPGDNQRAVSALCPPYLSAMVNVDSAGHALEIYTAAVVVPAAHKAEPLQTKRFLHVERDSMGAPPANEVFAGPGPNEDINSGNIGNPSIALMVTNYRPAFLDVTDAFIQFLGGDPRDDGQWVHNNLGPLRGQNFTPQDEAAAAASGESVRDTRSRQPFWVVQIYAAYEGPAEQDYDGEGDFTLGYAPLQDQDGPCIIYLETIRDTAQNNKNENKVAEPKLIERVVLHESLHHFNMIHDAEVGFGNEGPLNGDMNLSGADAFNVLTPGQLSEVRSTAYPD